ncbi:MAG: peptidylprolyl isomerase [Lautropia sp.]
MNEQTLPPAIGQAGSSVPRRVRRGVLTALAAAASAGALALLPGIGAGTGAAWAQRASVASATPIDRIVAVVNQEAITARELDGRVTMIEGQLREQNRPMPPREVMARQVLEQMITLRAQLQYAGEIGIKPSEAELDRAVAEVAQRNGVTLQQMREQMSSQGISMPSFREQLAGEIATMRLREREASSKVTISEAEVDALLAKSGSSTAVEYELGHILLRLPSNPDPAVVKTKGELAEQLLARARSGTEFAALAREYSDSPEGIQGGSLGWRTADRLPELFVDAVAKLEVGQVAPVIRSPAGFHLLRVIDKRAQSPQAATIERTHARHILLAAPSPEMEADAIRRLTEYKQAIEAGRAGFADMAREFSVDSSAKNGGDLGWLYNGETVPEFDRQMRTLPIDKISEPFRTQFGVHILQVLERRSDPDSPERTRAIARQQLREQKADEAFEQWLRELRDRAYVEYRLEQS